MFEYCGEKIKQNLFENEFIVHYILQAGHRHAHSKIPLYMIFFK